VSVDRAPAGRPRRVDPDLVDVRAAQADRADFGILYRRYLDRVYGYCFYLLGDHHDAEDATERTFLSALSAIDRFSDDGATFRSWLFRIAHNQLANTLRARSRQRVEPLDGVPEPASTGGDPSRLAGLADDARRLRAAVASLSEDRRQVVILRFVDGLSAREIGVVLGRSEGAIRVLQHRALRELAAHLEAASSG
jgi:RNA polymerase sigma-70 factor (ECF subfamily)